MALAGISDPDDCDIPESKSIDVRWVTLGDAELRLAGLGRGGGMKLPRTSVCHFRIESAEADELGPAVEGEGDLALSRFSYSSALPAFSHSSTSVISRKAVMIR